MKRLGGATAGPQMNVHRDRGEPWCRFKRHSLRALVAQGNLEDSKLGIDASRTSTSAPLSPMSLTLPQR